MIDIGYRYQEHRTCPVCKRGLTKSDIYQITYKPEEMIVQEEHTTTTNANPGPSTLGTSAPGNEIEIYTGINSNTLHEIKCIDLKQSFGSKIDMMVRHLLWIRKN